MTTPAQPNQLARFVEAQDRGNTYDRAVAELRAGQKSSHWMWFVFPQIAGLGRSPTAQLYAVRSLGEARDYLEHPILGPRLLECTRIVVELDPSPRSAEDIFGATDALKLRSSMTLFARAAPNEPIFMQALNRYFGGEADAETDRLLRAGWTLST